MVTIYCPNCAPDYLNGLIPSPPTILDGYGCHRCGIGWDSRDRDRAIQLFSQMLHTHMDHVTDWLALFLANEGPLAIVKAQALAEDWDRQSHGANWWAVSNLKHTVVLALYARYCQWEKDAWPICQAEAQEVSQ